MYHALVSPTLRPNVRILVGALLVLATLLVGCVKQATLPRENPQDSDQEMLSAAVLEVLTGEGYAIDARTEDGRSTQTQWLRAGERAQRIKIQITQTSMGLALSTQVERVTLAEPGAQGDDLVVIGHDLVVLDHGREDERWRAEPTRELEQQEEARIGRAVESAWRARRHAQSAH